MSLSSTKNGKLNIKKIRSNLAVAGDLTEGSLVFGTTVATNALLERTQARTLLLVTKGFKDLLHIGDMTRPDLFDVQSQWPAPLDAVIEEVEGRMDASGEEVTPTHASRTRLFLVRCCSDCPIT